MRDTEKNLTTCWDSELQRSCFVVKCITAHEVVEVTNNNICMLSDGKYGVHLPGSPLRLSERQQSPHHILNQFTDSFVNTCKNPQHSLPMKRILPSTLRLLLDLCSSSSGVSGPSFLSKAEMKIN